MVGKERLPTFAHGLAIACAILGCSPLSEIGVGGGDAAMDRPADTRSDTAPDRRDDRGTTPDVRPEDVVAERKACSDDLDTDPRNCGRCGHDCEGGACKGGACQPYALVTGNLGPYGVAVHDGVVYFTSIDDTVEKCHAKDCTNTLVQMTSGQGFPKGITTDFTNVYWANEGFVSSGSFAGGIATCGLAGCPSGKATVLAPTESGPYDVVVDTSAVYWTDEFGELVRSCSVGGCGGAPKTLATDVTLLSGIAIDATSVFFAETKLGNIIKCPLAGCASLTPFASGQMNPTKLDIAGATLYWAANGAIMGCPTSGCSGAPAVFAKNQTNSYAIAHDATNLYWTLLDNVGEILSCPLAGCTTPTVLADMQAQPQSVAVDDVSVYWANSAGGSVMRVMK